MSVPLSTHTAASQNGGGQKPQHPLWVLHWPMGSQPIMDAAVIATHGFTQADDITQWQQAHQSNAEQAVLPLLLITCPPLTHVQQKEFFDWFNTAISEEQRPYVALATNSPVENWITTLWELKLGRYIQLNKPDAIAWVHLWQQYHHQRLQQQAFSFAESLGLQQGVTAIINSSDGIHQYRESLPIHLGQHPHLPNMSTAIIEAIYNACYHGPPHGNYTKGQPFTIDDAKDTVTVNTGQLNCFSEPLHAISVIDQWGRLTTPPVLKGIKRHTTGEGVLDVSGRGHFLMSALSSQWAVAVSPNQRTEYMLTKVLADSPSLEKASPHLLVFE